MLSPELLRNFTGFEWDKGNAGKNLRKHRVSDEECEEVLTNAPLFLFSDLKHSEGEDRYLAYGITNEGRMIIVAFTMRGTKLRVISARAMNKKERALYEQEIEKTAKVQKRG